MDLSKEEFEDLYYLIYSGTDDPIRASNGTSESIKKHMRIFLRLEEIGLVSIEIRENKIYGAMETEKGKKVLHDKKYEKWFNEFDN